MAIGAAGAPADANAIDTAAILAARYSQVFNIY
jgi:hypothetical protein